MRDRAGSAATATSTTRSRPPRRCTRRACARVGDPRSRSALPERHVGAASSACADDACTPCTGSRRELPWRRVRARTRARAAGDVPEQSARMPTIATLATASRTRSRDRRTRSCCRSDTTPWRVTRTARWSFDAGDLRAHRAPARGGASCPCASSRRAATRCIRSRAAVTRSRPVCSRAREHARPMRRPRAYRRRLDELDEADRATAGRALCDLPRDRALQARARDPYDAARARRRGARALPRARRGGRAAGRLHGRRCSSC